MSKFFTINLALHFHMFTVPVKSKLSPSFLRDVNCFACYAIHVYTIPVAQDAIEM